MQPALKDGKDDIEIDFSFKGNVYMPSLGKLHYWMLKFVRETNKARLAVLHQELYVQGSVVLHITGA